jgi:MFS superfamily sulfate permease-like transporter
VVVASEPITDLDTTAADALRDLDAELAAEGVDLRFAEMKDPVKDRLKRYALYERFGDDHFYPTVGAAVSAYLDATGVEWTDWEDKGEVSPGSAASESRTRPR